MCKWGTTWAENGYKSLVWLYLAGFSVLWGALINVELARRRRLNAAREARRGFDELLAEKNK